MIGNNISSQDTAMSDNSESGINQDAIIQMLGRSLPSANTTTASNSTTSNNNNTSTSNNNSTPINRTTATSSTNAPIRPTAAIPANTTSSTANNNINPQSLVAQLLAAAANVQRQQESNSLVDLNEVLDAERVGNILENESESTLEPLYDLLPEGQRSGLADIRMHLRSAQFQQTVNRIESILNSEQYMGLLQSLSLQDSTGGIGVQAFLTAIQDQVKKEQDNKANNTNKK